MAETAAAPRFILAFDTALMGCAAALWDAESGEGWARVEPMGRGQSERLVPMVQEILQEAGQDFAAIDLIATTVGPGAFTGLRLGMSAARAWGLSLKRPVIGLTTLEVLAAKFYGAQAGTPLRLLIETKRSDFYTQLYDANGDPAGPPEALGFAVIIAGGDPDGTVVAGDGAARFAKMCAEAGRSAPSLRAGYEMIDPVCMAERARARFEATGAPSGMPEPLYLREADVTQSKKIQRQIASE